MAERNVGRNVALLAGPAYVWLTVTIFIPLAVMLVFSFLTVAPIGGRVAEFTFKQYISIFTRESYLINIWRSLKLGFSVTFFCLLIGFPMALILAKHIKGRSREAILLLIVLPFWSNGLVRIFSWTMVLSDQGIIGQAFHFFWPGGPSLNLLFTYPAIVIGLVHGYLPYMVLTCYVSLQAIDDSLIEASRSLGASALTTFYRITLPLSTPGIVAGSVLIFVPVIGSFMEPRILGGQQSIMLGTIIENQFTATFNWPLGAALAFTMLAVVFVILGLFYRPLRRHLEN